MKYINIRIHLMHIRQNYTETLLWNLLTDLIFLIWKFPFKNILTNCSTNKNILKIQFDYSNERNLLEENWLLLIIITVCIVTTSCMSFVADLRDAIHSFHFADKRLSQLPTPQAASSSSHNHRVGQRCFCLWGFISDSLKVYRVGIPSRRLKGRKKFQTCGT